MKKNRTDRTFYFQFTVRESQSKVHWEQEFTGHFAPRWIISFFREEQFQHVRQRMRREPGHKTVCLFGTDVFLVYVAFSSIIYRLWWWFLSFISWISLLWWSYLTPSEVWRSILQVDSCRWTFILHLVNHHNSWMQPVTSHQTQFRQFVFVQERSCRCQMSFRISLMDHSGCHSGAPRTLLWYSKCGDRSF